MQYCYAIRKLLCDGWTQSHSGCCWCKLLALCAPCKYIYKVAQIVCTVQIHIQGGTDCDKTNIVVLYLNTESWTRQQLVCQMVCFH